MKSEKYHNCENKSAARKMGDLLPLFIRIRTYQHKLKIKVEMYQRQIEVEINSYRESASWPSSPLPSSVASVPEVRNPALGPSIRATLDTFRALCCLKGSTFPSLFSCLWSKKSLKLSSEHVTVSHFCITTLNVADG